MRIEAATGIRVKAEISQPQLMSKCSRGFVLIDSILHGAACLGIHWDWNPPLSVVRVEGALLQTLLIAKPNVLLLLRRYSRK